MGNPEGYFSSFFLPPALFFRLEEAVALGSNYTLPLEVHVRAGREEPHYK